MDDPDPECKFCRDVVMTWVPAKVNIGGSIASAAVDVTQKILEEDYGQSNWNDSMREGDVANKSSPRPRAEQDVIDKLTHDAKEYANAPKARASIWAGTSNGPPQNIIAQAVAGAKAQGALAKQEGRNPMDMLSEAGKKGELNIPFRPLMRG